MQKLKRETKISAESNSCLISTRKSKTEKEYFLQTLTDFLSYNGYLPSSVMKKRLYITLLRPVITYVAKRSHYEK